MSCPAGQIILPATALTATGLDCNCMCAKHVQQAMSVYHIYSCLWQCSAASNERIISCCMQLWTTSKPAWLRILSHCKYCIVSSIPVVLVCRHPIVPCPDVLTWNKPPPQLRSNVSRKLQTFAFCRCDTACLFTPHVYCSCDVQMHTHVHTTTKDTLQRMFSNLMLHTLFICMHLRL